MNKIQPNAYHVDTKPWYKYFWPWFALAIIFWTFMSGIGMVYFSSAGSHYSVVDGYNKIGKAAFDDQSWQQRAKSLGVSADLVRNQKNLTITLDPKHYNNLKDIELVILHPTDEKKDIYPALTLQNNSIVTEIPLTINGWTIKLRDNKNQWEVKNKFATRIQAMVKLR